MERLTTKNKQFNDYSVAESLRHSDVRDYLYSINQKMGKYEDLEEQIGCPLEVRCKLYEGQEIYDRTNRKCEITHLYKRDFMVKVKVQQDITFRILYKNYKKTWWTKSDRSE